MPALVLGGVRVPIAANDGSAEIRPIEVGDRTPAFDGSPLSTVRATKDVLAIDTAPMVLADALTLRAQVETIPNSASGDLVGATLECHPRLVSFSHLRGGRARMSFELAFV